MDEKTKSELEIKPIDIVASAMKSAAGILIPIGPLLNELIGYTIPNQRIERLIKYSTQLEGKIKNIDNSLLKLALQDENFTDLMEESVRQAARSLSDERREYIASIIANSLKPETIDYIESKQILKILGEINDIEVIVLRYHLCPLYAGDNEFRQKHETIIKFKRATIKSTQSELDKAALHNSYRKHLVHLGLLKPKYETIQYKDNTYLPIVDSSGLQQITRYEITGLGLLVLRQIDLNYDYRANFPQ